MSSSPTPDVDASAGRGQSIGRVLPTASRNQRDHQPKKGMSPARRLNRFRRRLQSLHRPHLPSQLFKRKRRSANSQWPGQTVQDQSRNLTGNHALADNGAVTTNNDRSSTDPRARLSQDMRDNLAFKPFLLQINRSKHS